MYLVLRQTDDGLTIEQVDPPEIEKRLATNYYGENPTILHELPPFADGYFRAKGNILLILKCEVVVPRAREVVTRWTMP